MFRAGFGPEGMMSRVIRHAEEKEKKVRGNALHIECLQLKCPRAVRCSKMDCFGSESILFSRVIVFLEPMPLFYFKIHMKSEEASESFCISL